jgi:hypothetical protein
VHRRMLTLQTCHISVQGKAFICGLSPIVE